MNNSAILEKSHNLLSPRCIYNLILLVVEFYMITFYVIDPLQITSSFQVLPTLSKSIKVFTCNHIRAKQSPQWSVLYYYSAMSCLLSPLLKVLIQVNAGKDGKVDVGGEEGLYY